MQRALLLDVVVGERAAVLELLAGEDQALLVGREVGRGTRDALGLDLDFDLLDRVGCTDMERLRLTPVVLDVNLLQLSGER